MDKTGERSVNKNFIPNFLYLLVTFAFLFTQQISVIAICEYNGEH